jgi:PAS domain S-box-containing protein
MNDTNMDKKNYTILVVEDNPGDYLLIEDYLQEHILDPSLIHVKKFQDALDVLNNNKSKIDLLFLDLSLPDISKEELIYQLKKITHFIPVIILTGYTDVEFATKSLAVGVSDYLLKDTITPLVLYKSLIYSKERFGFLKSLLLSEKQNMDLFDLNPTPMWVFDSETLEFMEVNKAAIDLYGYTKEEFLKMNLKDIRPSEDIDIMHEVVNKTLSGKNNLLKNAVFRHQIKDGSIIFVEISNNIIDYNNKKAIIAIATDVTEKRSHIEAIKEQNTKLKEIAWMQSHVVRTPLSRLMSLIDVLKSTHLSIDEKEQMLNQILIASNEIDMVVKEIVSKADRVIKDVN